MRVTGKIVLVTGAAGGIGAAVGRLLADEGARVTLADIDGPGARNVADAIGGAADGVDLDVSSADSWDAAVAGVQARSGGLDVLVNCAGFYRPARLEDATEADLRRMFEVNQLGTFLGMKHALAPMRKRGGGSIVNISSGAGLEGIPMLAGYASTKFAIRGLTRCAAMELGADGIRVNSVHPGGIDTPMVKRSAASEQVYAALPVPRIGTAEEVARLVLYLASDESSYCTGSEFVIDGGMSAGVFLSVIGPAG